MKSVLKVLNRVGIDVDIYTDEAKAAAATEAGKGRRIYVLEKTNAKGIHIRQVHGYTKISYPYNMRGLLPGAIIAEEMPTLARIVDSSKAQRLSNLICEIYDLERSLVTTWRQYQKEMREKDMIVTYAASIKHIQQHRYVQKANLYSNTLEIVTKPLLMSTPLYQHPVPIGRLRIIYSFPHASFSVYPHAHPHVFSSGAVCWGEVENIRKASTNELAVVFDLLMDILTTHNPSSETRPINVLLDSLNIRIIHEE